MRRVVFIVGLLFSIQLLVACSALSRGPSPPADMNSPDAAFVYGYVETDNDTIEQVDFLKYQDIYVSPFKSPPRVMVFNNGMFMAENINPGHYVIAAVRTQRNNFNLANSKREAYQHIYNILPGEMRFLGSYNLRVVRKDNVIAFGEFKVTELQRPGERDVLKFLYDATDGTVWQKKIARRLKELRQ
jgi:hypothetical protein